MSDLKKTAFTSLYENDVQEWEEVMGYQVAAVVVGTEKEYAALRTDVIAQDYSMLYKWFVEGPAARETVNALVSRDVAELPVNRIAYAAVVNEDGGMVDDVTVSVLRDDALLVIGGNPEVFDALNQAAPAGTTVEERRENYGVLSVQGPKSRELLQRLTDADLSNENLPFYGLLTDISIAGVTASIFRVGFTGELGYEVMIGAADAEKLYTAVYAQTDLGVTPFSGGALMIARIEAGFVLADVDYDPAVSPYECSIGFAVDLEKGDFRGREALVARKADAPVRLVGVASDAAPEVFEGAQLSYNGANVGEVVMAVPSPALGGRTLSLVRVANEAATVGTRLIASVGGNDFEAEVVATPAHDPQRLRRRS